MTDNLVESNTSPALREAYATEGSRAVELTGAWTLRNLTTVLRTLDPRLKAYAADPALHWAMQGIAELDNAGALLLWQAWGKQKPQNLTLRPEHAALFDRLNALSETALPSSPRELLTPVILLGKRTLSLADHGQGFLALLGQLGLDIVHLARRPTLIPWREISANLYRTGAQALAITGLLGFLIGVVLSYLFSKQLKTFGADIFIINILGISILRELGPVIAAVLVAGRSASAMTAQLGVMRVTQELDALAIMGIPYSVRLVYPR